MAIDIEAFLEHLRFSAMSESHIMLFREMCEHIDEDTLSRICIEHISSEHDTPEALADSMESVVVDRTSEMSDTEDDPEIDEEYLKDSIKDNFAYIYSLFDIGAKDVAMDMMKDVMEALHIAQSLPSFKNDGQFLRELEEELHECLESDNPSDWFGYEEGYEEEENELEGPIPPCISTGALNIYNSVKHSVPDGLRNEFLTLASNRSDMMGFVRFFKDNVLTGLDVDLEIVLSYNIAIDQCTEDLMLFEYEDEEDAFSHILDDLSELDPYIQDEMTRSFSFLIFMEGWGMHNEAMDVLRRIVDTIDMNIRDGRVDPEGIVPALQEMKGRIRTSMEKDDTLGWMNQDMVELNTILFRY